MKNIVRNLLLLVVIVSLFSCSSDDGPSVDPELFATWTLTTTVFRDCTDSSLDEVINETCDANNCQKMVLDNDYTYQIIKTVRGTDQVTSGTFEVIGNEIQLVSSAGGAEIVEFAVTSSSLVFSADVLVCQQNLVYIK